MLLFLRFLEKSMGCMANYLGCNCNHIPPQQTYHPSVEPPFNVPAQQLCEMTLKVPSGFSPSLIVLDATVAACISL